MASSRAREIAELAADELYIPDPVPDAETIEHAIQQFAREMAEKWNGELKGARGSLYSYDWVAATRRRVSEILDAAGITEGRDER